MSFPRSVAEVTPDWLRERLLEKGVPGAGVLRALNAEPVARQGMSSVAHVLTLEYERPVTDAPHRVLAKFSSDFEPVKDAFAANRGFEREVTFYERFGRDASLPVPRCYWAGYDGTENRCGLLLEYIERSHLTDVFSGTIGEIAQVADALAPLHAGRWNRSADLEGLVHGQAPFMVDLILRKLPAALETIRSRYRADVGDTLVGLLELWIPNAHRFAARERSGPQTLCHGDLHREQILFPVDEATPPCIIDWQLSGRGHGAADLAQLLVSGLRPEQRKTAEQSLVERYYEGLVSHGVQGYTIDALWAGYRLGIARLAMFYMTAFAMGDIAPTIAWWDSDDKRRGFSFWDVICGWTTQALDEHGVADHLRRLA